MLYKNNPYMPHKSNNQKYLRSHSNYPQKRNLKNLKYIFLFILLISAGFLAKNITNSKHTSDSTGKVLSSTSKISAINLNLPSVDIKPLKIIPEKKEVISDPYIPAKSAILLDVENSYPLYEKNADAQVPIASITKIMTAIIAIEEYSLNKTAIVPRSAATVSGSKMNLITGEKITVKDLLYGLMLVSGNDAAYTLASMDPESKNGDIKPFVEKMNKKAQKLGLTKTHYYCPAGLDDNGYSTPHDLAFLTAYALNNKIFAELVSTTQKVVTSTDNRFRHDLTNSNRLIVPSENLYLPSAIGVKTGYTELAGHSLVAAARQDGHTLVSVILNTNNPAKPESARLNRLLLTWGYSSYIWPEN